MKLKNFLDVLNLIFDSQYKLERVYERIDNIIYIEYKVKKNAETIVDVELMASYGFLDKAIDEIERMVLDQMIKETKNELGID